MSSNLTDIKQFLYVWCGKQQKKPQYEFTQINNKMRPRFKSEVRVDGYSYVGIGNSTSKKDAQTNSALDFCQYLVRIGILQQSDLPSIEIIPKAWQWRAKSFLTKSNSLSESDL